jgi:hypothetical protein
MKRSQAVTAVLLCTLFTVGWASLGVTGEPHEAAVMPFDGYVKAIKITLCGVEPGQCKGAMVLAKKEGGEVSIGITPGMRIIRGEHLLTIEELEAGDYVRVRAIQVAGEILLRILTVEVMSP